MGISDGSAVSNGGPSAGAATPGSVQPAAPAATVPDPVGGQPTEPPAPAGSQPTEPPAPAGNPAAPGDTQQLVQQMQAQMQQQMQRQMQQMQQQMQQQVQQLMQQLTSAPTAQPAQQPDHRDEPAERVQRRVTAPGVDDTTTAAHAAGNDATIAAASTPAPAPTAQPAQQPDHRDEPAGERVPQSDDAAPEGEHGAAGSEEAAAAAHLEAVAPAVPTLARPTTRFGHPSASSVTIRPRTLPTLEEGDESSDSLLQSPAASLSLSLGGSSPAALTASTALTAPPLEEAALVKLSLENLKRLCEDRDLPVSGNSKLLVARLLERPLTLAQCQSSAASVLDLERTLSLLSPATAPTHGELKKEELRTRIAAVFATSAPTDEHTGTHAAPTHADPTHTASPGPGSELGGGQENQDFSLVDQTVPFDHEKELEMEEISKISGKSGKMAEIRPPVPHSSLDLSYQVTPALAQAKLSTVVPFADLEPGVVTAFSDFDGDLRERSVMLFATTEAGVETILPLDAHSVSISKVVVVSHEPTAATDPSGNSTPAVVYLEAELTHDAVSNYTDSETEDMTPRGLRRGSRIRFAVQDNNPQWSTITAGEELSTQSWLYAMVDTNFTDTMGVEASHGALTPECSFLSQVATDSKVSWLPDTLLSADDSVQRSKHVLESLRRSLDARGKVSLDSEPAHESLSAFMAVAARAAAGQDGEDDDFDTASESEAEAQTALATTKSSPVRVPKWRFQAFMKGPVSPQRLAQTEGFEFVPVGPADQTTMEPEPEDGGSLSAAQDDSSQAALEAAKSAKGKRRSILKKAQQAQAATGSPADTSAAAKPDLPPTPQVVNQVRSLLTPSPPTSEAATEGSTGPESDDVPPPATAEADDLLNQLRDRAEAEAKRNKKLSHTVSDLRERSLTTDLELDQKSKEIAALQAQLEAQQHEAEARIQQAAQEQKEENKKLKRVLEATLRQREALQGPATLNPAQAKLPPHLQKQLLPVVQRLKEACSDDETRAAKELELWFKPTGNEQYVYAQMCQMENQMAAVQIDADSFVLALVVDDTPAPELITIRPTAEDTPKAALTAQFVRTPVGFAGYHKDDKTEFVAGMKATSWSEFMESRALSAALRGRRATLQRQIVIHRSRLLRPKWLTARKTPAPARPNADDSPSSGSDSDEDGDEDIVNAAVNGDRAPRDPAELAVQVLLEDQIEPPTDESDAAAAPEVELAASANEADAEATAELEQERADGPRSRSKSALAGSETDLSRRLSTVFANTQQSHDLLDPSEAAELVENLAAAVPATADTAASDPGKQTLELSFEPEPEPMPETSTEGETSESASDDSDDELSRGDPTHCLGVVVVTVAGLMDKEMASRDGHAVTGRGVESILTSMRAQLELYRDEDRGAIAAAGVRPCRPGSGQPKSATLVLVANSEAEMRAEAQRAIRDLFNLELTVSAGSDPAQLDLDTIYSLDCPPLTNMLDLGAAEAAMALDGVGNAVLGSPLLLRAVVSHDCVLQPNFKPKRKIWKSSGNMADDLKRCGASSRLTRCAAGMQQKTNNTIAPTLEATRLPPTFVRQMPPSIHLGDLLDKHPDVSVHDGALRRTIIKQHVEAADGAVHLQSGGEGGPSPSKFGSNPASDGLTAMQLATSVTDGIVQAMQSSGMRSNKFNASQFRNTLESETKKAGRNLTAAVTGSDGKFHGRKNEDDVFYFTDLIDGTLEILSEVLTRDHGIEKQTAAHTEHLLEAQAYVLDKMMGDKPRATENQGLCSDSPQTWLVTTTAEFALNMKTVTKDADGAALTPAQKTIIPWHPNPKLRPHPAQCIRAELIKQFKTESSPDKLLKELISKRAQRSGRTLSELEEKGQLETDLEHFYKRLFELETTEGSGHFVPRPRRSRSPESFHEELRSGARGWRSKSKNRARLAQVARQAVVEFPTLLSAAVSTASKTKDAQKAMERLDKHPTKSFSTTACVDAHIITKFFPSVLDDEELQCKYDIDVVENMSFDAEEHGTHPEFWIDAFRDWWLDPDETPTAGQSWQALFKLHCADAYDAQITMPTAVGHRRPSPKSPARRRLPKADRMSQSAGAVTNPEQDSADVDGDGDPGDEKRRAAREEAGPLRHIHPFDLDRLTKLIQDCPEANHTDPELAKHLAYDFYYAVMETRVGHHMTLDDKQLQAVEALHKACPMAFSCFWCTSQRQNLKLREGSAKQGACLPTDAPGLHAWPACERWQLYCKRIEGTECTPATQDHQDCTWARDGKQVYSKLRGKDVTIPGVRRREGAALADLARTLLKHLQQTPAAESKQVKFQPERDSNRTVASMEWLEDDELRDEYDGIYVLPGGKQGPKNFPKALLGHCVGALLDPRAYVSSKRSKKKRNHSSNWADKVLAEAEQQMDATGSHDDLDGNIAAILDTLNTNHGVQMEWRPDVWEGLGGVQIVSAENEGDSDPLDGRGSLN